MTFDLCEFVDKFDYLTHTTEIARTIKIWLSNMHDTLLNN